MIAEPETEATAAYPLLIKQLLLTPLRHAPTQEIVYSDLVRYDYATLNRRIARLAHALESAGVKAGDTVAILDWDSHRYLESYFAVPMLGATLQIVNVRLSKEQIGYTLKHAAPKLLLVNDDFEALVLDIQRDLDLRWPIIRLTDSVEQTSGLAALGEYEALLLSQPEHYGFADFDENTRATTFYTTGTTGHPKGVSFTHRQLVLHTLATMAAFASPAQGQRFHRGDVYMPLTPMFHVHAWGMPYVATLMGVKQVYPGRYQADAIADLIERERVTFSHCVPTILQMVLDSKRGLEVDLSRWKVVVGGASFPTGLASRALEHGIDAFAAYGMSETCPMLTVAQLPQDTDPCAPAVETRCMTGLPVPLVDLRIVDEHMRDVPHDGQTPGEVVARAPWLTAGYVGDPAASAALWRGGYLHTLLSG